MTFTFSSRRLSALALTAGAAILGLSGLAAPAPLVAQGGAYYTATFAAPVDEDRAVAGGVAWVCRDTTCVANKGSSRPSRVCRGLAREFGEITDFVADGEALEEDKLASCNGK